MSILAPERPGVLWAPEQAAATGRAAADRAAYVGLCVFTFLLYGRPMELFPSLFGGLPIVKAVAGATIACYALARVWRRERLTAKPVELWALLAIGGLGLLFAPLAPRPELSFETLSDLFLKVAIVFVLMINLLTTQARLETVLRIVIACSAGAAVAALWQYASGDMSWEASGSESRVRGLAGGMFLNANDLATAMVTTAPIAIALGASRRGVARALYALAGVLLIAGNVVSFSRAGFLALLAACGVLCWKLAPGRRAATVVIAGLALAALLALAPAGYSNRLASIFEPDLDETGSSHERAQLLERAVELAGEHAIVGLGMGNFRERSIRNLRAHNSYVEVLIELGVAGLAAYLAFLLMPLAGLRRIERTALAAGDEARRARLLAAGLQASLAAYLVCSAFASIQYVWFAYYLVGYAVALRAIASAEPWARALPSAAGVGRPADSRTGVLWGARASGA